LHRFLREKIFYHEGKKGAEGEVGKGFLDRINRMDRMGSGDVQGW
jgi:hypothetical protein